MSETRERELVERALNLIDAAEQAMLAERKEQYGERFTRDQEAAIRQKFTEQKRGVQVVAALSAQAKTTSPSALDASRDGQ